MVIGGRVTEMLDIESLVQAMDLGMPGMESDVVALGGASHA
jgi:hypothetical protein